jgi:quercetin dioxygenase-like cupin family protein
MLLVILAIGFALVARGQPKTEGGEFAELHRAEIADASNLEVVMGLIDRPGESVSPKHYHPGGEFGFVLEGAATVSTEGEPEATLKAGSSFYQPPGEWHVVRTHAEGARTVVFRVLEKGQPMVVTVE